MGVKNDIELKYFRQYSRTGNLVTNVEHGGQWKRLLSSLEHFLKIRTEPVGERFKNFLLRAQSTHLSRTRNRSFISLK